MGGACSRLWSSTPRATEAPTARAEPAYLAAATWNRSDGFVDLGSTIGLNLSLARPIRIPNSSWYAAAVANMRHGSEQVILRAIQGVARKQCGTRAHLGRGRCTPYWFGTRTVRYGRYSPARPRVQTSRGAWTGRTLKLGLEWGGAITLRLTI
jgi:hypothetical protein